MRTLLTNGHPVATDMEAQLKKLDDWSEAFARAQAGTKGLVLSAQPVRQAARASGTWASRGSRH